MTTDFIFKYPRSKTNTGEFVDMDTWAKSALSADDYTKFQAADARQKAITTSTAAVVDANPKEHGFFGVIIRHSDTPPTPDAEWLAFWDQYQADPNLVWSK